MINAIIQALSMKQANGQQEKREVMNELPIRSNLVKDEILVRAMAF